MPLGLQITTVGALGGPGMMGTKTAVVIEDYWWGIHAVAGSGHLTPIWDGTIPIPGSHDTWSLHPATSAQGFYSPKSVAIVSDEGYWDVHTISSGNDGVKPLDV